MKNKTLADETLSEADRASRVLGDDRMIIHLRRAIREYLLSCSAQDDEAEQRLWEAPEQPVETPEPELARAA